MATQLIFRSPRSKQKSGPIDAEDQKSIARLTHMGWHVVERIEVGESEDDTDAITPQDEPQLDVFARAGISDAQQKALVSAGFDSAEAITNASDDDLRKVDGIGPATVANLRKAVSAKE